MKTTVIDGKEIQVFCGCDEDWNDELHSAKAIINGEYNERCPKCDYFSWVHDADLKGDE